MKYDLLSNVSSGGCSAKLAPGRLNELLKKLPQAFNENLLVGNDNSDDAAVFIVNPETALIQTVDFFPPVCSDPYTFGQIAAANALSDIFAMGGQATLALNIVMFPADRVEIEVLENILQGGADKIKEAGAVLAGGHTIVDEIPKYGLAVTGFVHPDKIIANTKAAEGDVLILTKAVGTGVILAGDRIGEVSVENLTIALKSMSQLNNKASEIMQKYGVKCATDITGFGLLGHAKEIALASGKALEIELNKIPLLPGVNELAEMGCIPCAAFSNLKSFEEDILFDDKIDYNLKMIACDAQTSGGILMCASADSVGEIVEKLVDEGYASTKVIGRVTNELQDSKYCIRAF